MHAPADTTQDKLRLLQDRVERLEHEATDRRRPDVAAWKRWLQESVNEIDPDLWVREWIAAEREADRQERCDAADVEDAVAARELRW